MLHARDDYNRRIQDSAGTIPEDEPVYLIRGQDILGPTILRIYAELTELIGGQDVICDETIEHANRMLAWQHNNIRKVADMDENDVVRPER